MTEMSITSVVHRGVRYRIGDRFQSKYSIDGTMDLGGIETLGPILVTIVCIEQDHIGIKSETTIDGWHSLDDRVPHGHGYYVKASMLAEHFTPLPTKGFVVSEDVVFKNRNLKGMDCIVLKPIDGGAMYFVELSENVGAGGADGLGKSGHCVLLPASKVKRKQD